MARYKVLFPTPREKREAVLDLTFNGDKLTGTLTNPELPDEVKDIAGGIVSGSSFRAVVDFDRARYLLDGKIEGNRINFNAEVLEQKVLQPGKRLSGKSGELSGEYLLGVYSPGGVKMNHFVIDYRNGKITGEMYCIADREFLDTMKRIGEERQRNSPPPGPGDAGFEGSGGPPAFKLPNPGDKIDVSSFYNSTAAGNNFDIFTRTAQGSVFNFKGSVAGDTITATMFISNTHQGIEGTQIES